MQVKFCRGPYLFWCPDIWWFFFASLSPLLSLLSTPETTILWLFSVKTRTLGASLMIQWLRVCLPVQGCLATQSAPALRNPMACRLPGSPAHGILQARILEWIAIPFSRANTRDMSSVPGLGRSCVSQSILGHVPQLLSPCLEPSGCSS